MDKEDSEFYKRKSGKPYSYCKSCDNSNSASYYTDNRTAILAVSAVYRDSHDLKTTKATYYQNNKETIARKAKAFKVNNPSRYILQMCRTRSKLMKLECNLTIEDLKIPSICPILGIPLFYGNRRSDNTPSVDQIVPGFGYSKGNVQIISDKANRMKNNATPEDLIRFSEWVQRTYA